MAKVRYRQEPDADVTIRRLARPQVLDIGREIAERIPDNVPVQSGTSRRLFRSGLRAAPLAHPDYGARVSGLPPHWHWFEYGTRFNPPYAPIRRSIEQLGARYEKS